MSFVIPLLISAIGELTALPHLPPSPITNTLWHLLAANPVANGPSRSVSNGSVCFLRHHGWSNPPVDTSAYSSRVTQPALDKKREILRYAKSDHRCALADPDRIDSRTAFVRLSERRMCLVPPCSFHDFNPQVMNNPTMQLMTIANQSRFSSLSGKGLSKLRFLASSMFLLVSYTMMGLLTNF